MADAVSEPSETLAAPVANGRRRRLLTILAAVVVVGVVLYAIYWLLFASHYVSTDNAYVGADTAQVTPLVSGAVAKINVAETQQVKAGDVLVVLDDADAKINVAAAQADLSRAERRVQGYFASDTALAGQLAARNADIQKAEAGLASAQADFDRASLDLSRRKALAPSGAVSGDDLTGAQNRFANARSGLATAKAALAQATADRAAAVGNRQVNTALISGAPGAENPEVAAARAKLDAAELALSRTVIRAPVAGVIARKSVQMGQQVAIGAPLMAIVPTTTAYVDANFKEVQLKKVVIGQPVELSADLYGEGVKYHGTVKGLSGGTGSAFSLIPAQNASGNWIKVVQRLPVRIQLDPAELKEHPLRVGLSMKARIDIADRK